jgi:hypothetical protein
MLGESDGTRGDATIEQIGLSDRTRAHARLYGD